MSVHIEDYLRKHYKSYSSRMKASLQQQQVFCLENNYTTIIVICKSVTSAHDPAISWSSILFVCE